MTRPTVVNLSIVQALSLVIATVGGSGTWLVAAAVAHPADLGVLGRMVSTSTLMAGLITAGIGQFLLTVVRSATTQQIRHYLWIGCSVGATVSGIVAGAISGFQEHTFGLIVAASALFAIGVAINNLQDAVYLGTGLAQDVPLKGASILLVRLALLIGLIFIQIDRLTLLVAFVSSQLVVPIGWISHRAPKAFRQHAALTLDVPHVGTASTTLVLSYLYSIAVAAITTGVPAIITTLVSPDRAGRFYVAWTIVSVLASVSIAVANSVLAISLGPINPARQLGKIIAGLLSVLSFGGLLLILILPRLLAFINNQYIGVSSVIPPLVIGNIFFGVTVVSIAAYRAIGLSYHSVVIFVLWPLTIILAIIFGIKYSGLSGGIYGFAIGNLMSGIPIWVMAFMITSKYRISRNYETAPEG